MRSMPIIGIEHDHGERTELRGAVPSVRTVNEDRTALDRNQLDHHLRAREDLFQVRLPSGLAQSLQPPSTINSRPFTPFRKL